MKTSTVILIAVTGYEEILVQLRADPGLTGFEVVPSIFLESLYEDMLLLSAKKPPLNSLTSAAAKNKEKYACLAIKQENEMEVGGIEPPSK